MNTYPDFSAHNYQVVHELGRNREGGRISYLATSIDGQDRVVIKQFRFVQENTSWQGFKTYEREINILQAVNHPRIPRYLDSFETRDGFCMVQEYKDAPSLASKKSLTPTEIKDILVSILEILVDLQWRIPPIIHRDIKPENILVGKDNQAYLIDFGLARINNQELAMSSIIAGTPGFMPPEELFNRPLTKASDLYSLGATAIALLTSTPAAQVSNLIDNNYQFQFSHLSPLKTINPDFIDWLKIMVAPNLNDRFETAQSALEALRPIDITGVSTVERSKNRELNHTPTPSELVSGVASVTIVSIIFMFGALYAFGSFFLRTPVEQSSSVTKPKLKPEPEPVRQTLLGAEQWFQEIKSRCNAIEVMSAMRRTKHSSTVQGVGYAASCYALAGKLNLADRKIKELEPNLRPKAAEVLFSVALPIANNEENISVGKIMELVLRYLPDNALALYHAGMSAYIWDEHPKAEKHLRKFLRLYRDNDGREIEVKAVLERIEQNISATDGFGGHKYIDSAN